MNCSEQTRQSRMSLLMFLWTATALSFFKKNSLQLLKEKALKMIPEYGRTEAQSWPQGGGKNLKLHHISINTTLYVKMLCVALSGLFLICNSFQETQFYQLQVYFPACFYEIHIKFYLISIFTKAISSSGNNTNL